MAKASESEIDMINYASPKIRENLLMVTKILSGII